MTLFSHHCQLPAFGPVGRARRFPRRGTRLGQLDSEASVSACAWQGAVCLWSQGPQQRVMLCLFSSFSAELSKSLLTLWVRKNCPVPYSRYVAGEAGQTQYLYLSELLQSGVPSPTQAVVRKRGNVLFYLAQDPRETSILVKTKPRPINSFSREV